MKSLMTPNLIKFTFTSLLLTLLFRFALSSSISHKITIAVVCSAVIYALLMYANGSFFGRKEYEYLPIFDIGFRFHFSTFLTHNIVSVLWFLFGFESKYENIEVIYLTAAIWSIFLLIHFFYYMSARKSSIKNLNKEELFE